MSKRPDTLAHSALWNTQKADLVDRIQRAYSALADESVPYEERIKRSMILLKTGEEKLIKRIVQTCGACPAQWEGETDDGRHFYVRYRYGRICIGTSREDFDDAVEVAMSDDGYAAVVGEELSGYMDESEMMPHLLKALEEQP